MRLRIWSIGILRAHYQRIMLLSGIGYGVPIAQYLYGSCSFWPVVPRHGNYATLKILRPHSKKVDVASRGKEQSVWCQVKHDIQVQHATYSSCGPSAKRFHQYEPYSTVFDLPSSRRRLPHTSRVRNCLLRFRFRCSSTTLLQLLL